MSSVSEKFASFIKDTFFVEPVHILQQINEDKWTYKKRSITYDQIENHFNGDYYIGYVCQHTPVSVLVNFRIVHVDVPRIVGAFTCHLRNLFGGMTKGKGPPLITNFYCSIDAISNVRLTGRC